MNHIHQAIEEFHLLIEKHPDDPKSLSTFSHFFRYFLRLQSSNQSLPSIEIMTILKHKKPIVYTLLKRQSQNSPLMSMLTQVDIGLQEAEERLKSFKDTNRRDS